MSTPVPYRGTFGDPRPLSLQGLPLPPAPLPSHYGSRPLKAWRYVGVYGPEVMLCLASVRIGRARQTFWAVWDRDRGSLYQRTRLGAGGVRLWSGGARLEETSVKLELELDETPGVETIWPCEGAYAWTRKQGGIRAHGSLTLAGSRRRIDGPAIIDDTAAFYPRSTHWRWCAGVGRSAEGQEVAWNLVQGVNDPLTNSERTVWVDGLPREVGPCTFAADLTCVDELQFAPEASLERHQNFGLLRSDYRQPFGSFSGVLAGEIKLQDGYGVMEEHEAKW